MATLKTSGLISRNNGTLISSSIIKAHEVISMDSYIVQAASDLALNNRIIFNIRIPSNAIITEVSSCFDDCDTSTNLRISLGVAAAEEYTDITASKPTKHHIDDTIDSTFLLSSYAGLITSSAIFSIFYTPGLTTFNKKVFETLGYDSDPGCCFNLVLTVSAAPAGVSGNPQIAIRVKYLVA